MVVHLAPSGTPPDSAPVSAAGPAAPPERSGLESIKGAFLASLNHEIRTPLSGIIGMLDLLLETEVNEDQRDYINAARLCTESLSELLHAALEYSALEAGQVILDETEFSIREMLEAAVAAQQSKAELKHLTLGVTMHPDLPETMLGDAPRLRELIGHLVNNGIKFTHTGSVEVRASLAHTTQGTDLLIAEVHDTGVGIPPEKLAGIFESFRQGDQGLARAYPGLGLGLAVVQKLAKVMGGVIRVESQIGEGSTFTVEVPFRRPASQADTGKREAAGPMVLAVEDDPIGLTVLKHVLQRRLKRVDCVSSGQEAVKAARQRHYDLVLMDLQMPEMNGLETATAIRSLEGYSNVPILALTASCSDQIRAECLARGMQAFLSKPIDAHELWTAVSRYLGRDLALADTAR